MPSVADDDSREMPTTAVWREAMRAARKARRLSQAQLGAAVGCTQAMISEIERGTAQSSGHIMAICAALDLDPPVFYESDLDRRWREAGAALRRRKPELFREILSMAERMVYEVSDDH